jgi:hypothetical protein
MSDCGDGLGRGPRQSGGRHLSELEFFDDLFPNFAIVFECAGCPQGGKIHIAGFVSGVVTPGAVLLDERKYIARFYGVQRR